MEGSRPVIHDNVTWNSPYYNEFAEDGRHIPYNSRTGDRRSRDRSEVRES